MEKSNQRGSLTCKLSNHSGLGFSGTIRNWSDEADGVNRCHGKATEIYWMPAFPAP